MQSFVPASSYQASKSSAASWPVKPVDVFRRVLSFVEATGEERDAIVELKEAAWSEWLGAGWQAAGMDWCFKTSKAQRVSMMALAASMWPTAGLKKAVRPLVISPWEGERLSAAWRQADS